MEILLPQKGKAISSAIVKYPRGQTRFTSEEDDIIIKTVMSSIEFQVGEPFTSWAKLAEKLPGYKSKQIRDRWVNNLNPNINHAQFSEQDVSFCPLSCLHLRTNQSHTFSEGYQAL